MIELKDIHKSYPLQHGERKVVLKDVSITFHRGINVGILGLNGQGKSTLIKLINGTEHPDSGTIHRRARVSLPTGIFGGSFNASLTGRENIRFACRLYGADIKKVAKFVEDFTDLGPYMDMPLRTYSTGMRSKLGFGLSMGIGFDFYLIDEGFSIGDAAFTAKAENMFKERASDATLIVVSRFIGTVRKYCDKATVLHNGILTEYENFEDAVRVYQGISHGGH